MCEQPAATSYRGGPPPTHWPSAGPAFPCASPSHPPASGRRDTELHFLEACFYRRPDRSGDASYPTTAASATRGVAAAAAACDIRCCSRGATFVLKEVDMAIVADLAVLQRLPAAVDCRLRERRRPRAHGAKEITAMEAKEMGLVSRVFDSKKDLDAGIAKIAKEIAEKSAWAVMGAKAVLLRSRDVTVE
ncbi:delta(3,5)-Delta(2,4)-dienoyl-CoA isomerase, peroxisomal-like [Panicum virgatum]|uniref:delta(3,5)-Delta(2,4)-dienoyl-CoA isomerase, peroxisomal-like n=1 Tax=Panicum virgatum TaxID=38727 RepID=UPI0019D561B7|nr:delta(3,5)-Delta(2,4)-dienoyl-CoA isomerase, peroxisomal-like [Panicum virgatum]